MSLSCKVILRIAAVASLAGIASVTACDQTTGPRGTVPFYGELWLSGSKVAQFTSAQGYLVSGESIFAVAVSGTYKVVVEGELDGDEAVPQILTICNGASRLFHNYLNPDPNNLPDDYSSAGVAALSDGNWTGAFHMIGLSPPLISGEAGYVGAIELRSGGFNIPLTATSTNPDIACH